MQNAAPLMCAGITVYSPLVRWAAGPGKRVGVLGFGGLGHVAAQISRALGAQTTVFDLDASKRDDALRLGAAEFVTASDPDAFAGLSHSLDLIVCTVPANLDVDLYLGLLDVSGTFVTIGVPSGPLTIDPFSLIVNQRCVAGSRIGGLKETGVARSVGGRSGLPMPPFAGSLFTRVTRVRFRAQQLERV